MTHIASAFLQPTLWPHFFSARALKITGLRAACFCSLCAARVVLGKHNQKEQALCWHKLQCKRPDIRSHQELVFSLLPVAPPSTPSPAPVSAPLNAFKDLNCCWSSRCHPLADRAMETVTFLPIGKYLIGINSVKWAHLLCVPGDSLRWSTRIWSNSTNFGSFMQYPSQGNSASAPCSCVCNPLVARLPSRERTN